MAVSASISSTELRDAVVSRYVGQYFEAALINAPGVTYTPGSTNDPTFLGLEVALGTGGYAREVFGYSISDVISYTDRNVALNQKATVFPHDGSTTPIPFTHVALLWGTGNIVTLGAATAEPLTGIDGVYSNFRTETDGSGTGLILGLTITNDVFVYSIIKSGVNYAPGDVVTILAADLLAAGAIDGGDMTNVVLPVDSVSTSASAGNIVAVVQPTQQAALTSGNEAAFYWNLRQYGAS